MERWVGIVVVRGAITLVRMEVDNSGDTASSTVEDDKTIPLQNGDRGVAYRRLQEWLVTHLREHRPDGVVVKGSAVSGRGGATLGLLESAELRGAVMAAVAESGCPLHVAKRASLSKTFGERKVDDYVRDDSFWEERVGGSLRKGSREAAFITYATATTP